MYLPVCVYDCVAGKKKKSILSLSIFFLPNFPQQAFCWANRLLPRAQGWQFFCFMQATGRRHSLRLAAGLP